jgi:hypothetical protein
MTNQFRGFFENLDLPANDLIRPFGIREKRKTRWMSAKF